MGSQETIKVALNSIVFHHRLLSVLLIQSDLCPACICASTVCLSICNLSLSTFSFIASPHLFLCHLCTLVPVLIFCSATTISNLALGDRSLDMSPIEVVRVALHKWSIAYCPMSVHLFSLFSNSFCTLPCVPSLFVLTVQLPNLWRTQGALSCRSCCFSKRSVLCQVNFSCKVCIKYSKFFCSAIV